MPLYRGTGQAQILLNNRQAYLFKQETLGSQVVSVAFMLDRVTRRNGALEFDIVGSFTGPPGTFQIYVLMSEMDTLNAYVRGNLISSVDANNNFRFPGVGYCPKFVAMRIATNPSTGAQLTAILSR